jgi:hypothetical protein
MQGSKHLTSAFVSKVYVAGSDGAALADNSISKHEDCGSMFYNNITAATDQDKHNTMKCRMMRSAPMYLSNVQLSWSVLGAQSTSTLSKHIFVVFIVYSMFWFSQYAQKETVAFMKVFHDPIHRNVVVFLAIVAFGLALGLDVNSDMNAAVAIGSVSTAFSFVVVCLLIICFEYAGTKTPQQPSTSGDKSKNTAMQQMESGNDANKAEEDVNIIEPKDEYIHKNIYMSYALVLLFPMVVVFILSHSHTAIVDVHIQLVFFGFMFYAALDVFQTRTTSVLLCLHDIEKSTEQDQTRQAEQNQLRAKLHNDVHGVQVFVVLAFSLCKLFVLMPALVLLHTKYGDQPYQHVMLAAHHVVLFSFVLVDLLHVVSKTARPNVDVIKLFFMLIYTCLIFFTAIAVDFPTPKAA